MINLFVFIVMSATVISTSVLIMSLLKIDDLFSWFTGTYLIAYANITVTVIVLGIVGVLDNTLLVAIFQISLLMGASILWFLAHRPHLLPQPPGTFLQTYTDEIKASRLILFCVVIVAVVYAVNLALAVILPENIDDVIVSYTSRVGSWFEDGSILPFDSSERNRFQSIYPIGPQAKVYWFVAWSQNAHLAALSQWVTVPVIMAMIVGLSQRFGASRRNSILFALLWALLPSIVIMSTNALVDLIMTAVVIATLYFFIIGVKEESYGHLALSALALALTFATKFLIVLMLPGLGVFFGLIWLKETQKRGLIFKWGLMFVAAFAMVALYTYATNYAYYGGFTGPPLSSNLYALPTTLPGMMSFAHQNASSFMEDIVFNQVSLAIDKGWTYAGPLALVLLIIGSGKHLIEGVRLRDPYRVGLIAYIVLFFGVIFTVRSYSVATSRYIMPIFVIGMIFAATLSYSTRVCQWIVALSILIMLPAFAMGNTKPLIGSKAIWQADEIAIETRIMPGFEPLVRVLQSHINDDAHIGLVTPDKFPIGLVYGNDLRHPVTLIYPSPDTVDSTFLRERDIDLLVIQSDLVEAGLRISDDLNQVDQPDDRYILLMPAQMELSQGTE